MKIKAFCSRCRKAISEDITINQSLISSGVVANYKRKIILNDTTYFLCEKCYFETVGFVCPQTPEEDDEAVDKYLREKHEALTSVASGFKVDEHVKELETLEKPTEPEKIPSYDEDAGKEAKMFPPLDKAISDNWDGKSCIIPNPPHKEPMTDDDKKFKNLLAKGWRNLTDEEKKFIDSYPDEKTPENTVIIKEPEKPKDAVVTGGVKRKVYAPSAQKSELVKAGGTRIWNLLYAIEESGMKRNEFAEYYGFPARKMYNLIADFKNKSRISGSCEKYEPKSKDIKEFLSAVAKDMNASLDDMCVVYPRRAGSELYFKKYYAPTSVS